MDIIINTVNIDNTNDINNIADSIEALRKKIEEYGQLSDLEKLKRKDDYDKLVQERNKYDDILKSYWELLEGDNKKEVKESNQNIMELYKKVEEIRDKVEINEHTIEELLAYHDELYTIKAMIDKTANGDAHLNINYLNSI